MTLTSFWDGMVPPQVNIGYTWCVARHIPQIHIHMKKLSSAALTVLVSMLLLLSASSCGGSTIIIQYLEDGELKTTEVRYDDVKSFTDSLQVNNIKYWIE